MHADPNVKIRYPVLQLPVYTNADYLSIQYNLQLLLLLHNYLYREVHDAIALCLKFQQQLACGLAQPVWTY